MKKRSGHLPEDRFRHPGRDEHGKAHHPPLAISRNPSLISSQTRKCAMSHGGSHHAQLNGPRHAQAIDEQVAPRVGSFLGYHLGNKPPRYSQQKRRLRDRWQLFEVAAMGNSGRYLFACWWLDNVACWLFFCGRGRVIEPAAPFASPKVPNYLYNSNAN